MKKEYSFIIQRENASPHEVSFVCTEASPQRVGFIGDLEPSLEEITALQEDTKTFLKHILLHGHEYSWYTHTFRAYVEALHHEEQCPEFKASSIKDFIQKKVQSILLHDETSTYTTLLFFLLQEIAEATH